MNKIKLSEYLLNNGYFATRSQARNALKAGDVIVNNRIITKDGFLVSENDVIDVKLPENTYVSRGGHKLEAALKQFKIALSDKIVLDIGASTGGFTDCCLQNGARKVYSYDVGHDQLAEKIRNDSRVSWKEGINCRYLKKADFEETIDFICMDVSFISCTAILPNIADILDGSGQAVILFKPQFEVGIKYLNNKGIVTDKTAVDSVLEDCKKTAANLKLMLKGIIASPIKGQDGNQEYLMYFIKEN